MSGESNRSIEPLEESEPEETLSEQIVGLLEENTWILYGIAVNFLLLGVGYGLEIISGPPEPEEEIIHQVAGLFGAVTIIFFLMFVAIGIIWAALLYKESRYR
ncbi:hypothetical protein [Halomontanus rarus]|uniref:hypothetical protein n=1 Tax=Halomontanus rarus TaxID=3034020 RepID=UPI00293BDA0B|nr:hypothetical protein [Halovivax sp. KZCA124]